MNDRIFMKIIALTVFTAKIKVVPFHQLVSRCRYFDQLFLWSFDIFNTNFFQRNKKAWELRYHCMYADDTQLLAIGPTWLQQVCTTIWVCERLDGYQENENEGWQIWGHSWASGSKLKCAILYYYLSGY